MSAMHFSQGWGCGCEYQGCCFPSAYLKITVIRYLQCNMYKILIEAEKVGCLKETPFRKIVDPNNLLGQVQSEAIPVSLLEVRQMNGRVHLYRHYQRKEGEEGPKLNLTANKIDIKTQALLISQLPREELLPMMRLLREREQQLDTLDVVNEPGDSINVSLIISLHSIIATEQLYQLVLFNFHALPLYLQQATFLLTSLNKQQAKYCAQIANPHIPPQQLQSLITKQTWVELPRCLECLERLEYDLTGISSALFEQLTQSRSRANPCGTCITLTTHHPTACELCGTPEDNWMCVVCSHVGCGRYKNGDAFKHFWESGHILTLDLESQRVWNYLADCFSHRVIPLKQDPLRFPELPQHHRHNSEESLEAAFWEYCSVVSGQLQRQRAFYERQREEEEQRFQAQAAKTQAIRAEAEAQLLRREDQLRKQAKRNKKIQKRIEQVRESCKLQREVLANYERTIREEVKEQSLAEIERESPKIQEKLKILQDIDTEIEAILLKLTQ